MLRLGGGGEAGRQEGWFGGGDDGGEALHTVAVAVERDLLLPARGRRTRRSATTGASDNPQGVRRT